MADIQNNEAEDNIKLYSNAPQSAQDKEIPPAMQKSRKEVMEIRTHQQRQTLFCNHPNRSFAVKESRGYEH